MLFQSAYFGRSTQLKKKKHIRLLLTYFSIKTTLTHATVKSNKKLIVYHSIILLLLQSANHMSVTRFGRCEMSDNNTNKINNGL